jgi:tetraacyldisaccharide 4'-kinase
MSLARLLLLPLAAVYRAITEFRNHLYDIGYRRSFRFDTFVVGVGNLSAGGSGKTPMVEYLADWLAQRYRIAVLSRGYGRSTRGFRIAGPDDDARSIGDEPFQMHVKFGDQILVTVGEDRALAIPEILYHREDTQVILLDDAFQHRRVLPNLNLLLTSYRHPFFNDYVLPAGMLRESRVNAARADAVVMTKCPDTLTAEQMDELRGRMAAYTRPGTEIFFAGIQYLAARSVFGEEHSPGREAFAFCGIAQPEPLLDYLGAHFRIAGFRRFPDHQPYDLNFLRKRVVVPYLKEGGPELTLITTEKDAARIRRLPGAAALFAGIPLLYLPVKMKFLEDEALFKDMMLAKIRSSVA